MWQLATIVASFATPAPPVGGRSDLPKAQRYAGCRGIMVCINVASFIRYMIAGKALDHDSVLDKQSRQVLFGLRDDASHELDE